MRRIAYYCRGFGYGHASRAELMVDTLRKFGVDVSLYATGTARTYLERHGVQYGDLCIEDEEDHTASAISRCSSHAKSLVDVDGVISDELFYIPAIFAGLGVPTVSLTCRLGHELETPMIDDLLEKARHVIVPDFQGVHEPMLKKRYSYSFTGPLVKTVSVTRSEARQRIGWNRDRKVFLLAAGSSHWSKREAVDRLIVLLEYAAREIGGHLLVLGDRDTGERGDLEYTGFSATPELYYAAADIVATVGGLSTLEAARQVPTIVLPVADELLVVRRAQYLADVGLAHVLTGLEDESGVADLISSILTDERSASSGRTEVEWASPVDVARLILGHLQA